MSDGEGTVTDTRPLAGEVRVKLEGNDKDAPKIYKVRDIKVLRPGQRQKNEDDDEGDVIDD